MEERLITKGNRREFGVGWKMNCIMTVVVDTYLYMFVRRHETVHHRQWLLLCTNLNINLKAKWFKKMINSVLGVPCFGEGFFPSWTIGEAEKSSLSQDWGHHLELNLGIMEKVASEHFCSSHGVRGQSKCSTRIYGPVKLLNFKDKQNC